MRKDMFKVIVERPRHGVGYCRGLHNAYRQAKRFKLDDEDDVFDSFSGTKLPMKGTQGDRTKSLNENLNPLRRFLNSKVGQLWNDVYSEICENINVNSTVQQHILTHVEDFIDVKTYVGDDGKIYCKSYNGVIYEIHQKYRRHGSGLYVDPRTGIVCRLEPRSWKYKGDDAAKLAKTFRVFLKDRVAFVKEDGIWFKLFLVPIPDPLPLAYVPGFPMAELDVSGKVTQPWKNERRYYVENCVKVYGGEVHGPRRQTACKKDIRKYGLRDLR